MEENKSLNNEESVEEYEIDFIKEAEKYNIYSEEATKVSLKTKIAFTAVIIAVVLLLAWPNLKSVKIALGISTLLSLGALLNSLFSHKKIDYYRHNEKRLNGLTLIFSFIELLIIGISFTIFLCLENIEFNDKNICTYGSVISCVDNKDGTSTCNFLNRLEVPCSTELVKDKLK